MQFVVGAYAAAPGAGTWDPVAEADYLAGVAAIPGFRGLELPWTGRLHRDELWLLAHLDPGWDLVLTAIPGTVARTAAEPAFGLASPDKERRRAAIDFTAGLRDAVHRLHDHLGRASVLSVELHSAPKAVASAEAFADALGEVATWDWAGAALTVEHCDAYRPGQPAQKGYLSLADELRVVGQLDGVAGVTVNWGRSAIEGRGTATVPEHLAQAVAAGALVGLMFSGAAAEPGPFGEPWLDAHLPPSRGSDPAYADLDACEPSSLLGPDEIGRALRVAGGRQLFTGVKIGVRPAELPVPRRIAYLRDAVRLIDRVGAAG